MRLYSRSWVGLGSLLPAAFCYSKHLHPAQTDVSTGPRAAPFIGPFSLPAILTVRNSLVLMINLMFSLRAEFSRVGYIQPMGVL
jgi:hypothetical protein